MNAGYPTIGVAALATVLGLLSGCSGFGPEPEPQMGTLKAVASYIDITLPLDAYVPTPEQQDTLLQAHVLLVRECSKRFGYDIRLPYAPTSQAERELVTGGRYGLFVAEYARAFGYDPPTHLAPASAPRKEGGWNPTDEEFVVANGKDRYTAQSKEGTLINGVKVPADGCNGEAARQLSQGAPDTDIHFAETLAVESHQRAEQDSRVRKAEADWSDCMKRAGYTYDNPWAPNDKKWPEPPTTEEINTAVADVACKHEVRLVDTWLAVETAYQNRLIEKNAQRLDSVKKAIDQRLRNANQVLIGR